MCFVFYYCIHLIDQIKHKVEINKQRFAGRIIFGAGPIIFSDNSTNINIEKGELLFKMRSFEYLK